MRKLLMSGLLFVLLLCLLSGCSTSIKEQQKEAVKNVNDIFLSTPKSGNKTTKNFTFYLPFGMTLKEESPNNVIIKRGNQNYILFYNQKVNEKSQEVYKISKPDQGIVVDKIFNTKKRFGYLFISQVKKKLYEVTVGIGGEKMTTETELNHISSDAEKMMKIISSLKYKK